MWTSEIISDQLWEQEYRSPGLHVSDVLDYIQLREKSCVDPSNKKNFGPGWAEVGKIFEHGHVAGLIRKHPDRYMLGKEGKKDGLYYTPDLHEVNSKGKKISIGDAKCTWKSPGNGITDPKFERWISQIMAYAWCEKTTDVFFDVIYLYGARFGEEPIRLRWRETYSPQTLWANWKRILMYAELMKGEQR
jgi:hypothetical protein